MKTKKRTIYNALPIVAAAYAERFGVKVAMGNDTAYTDGQTIVVPNIPEDYPHMEAVWGYLAHEAAHVRFTDFSVNRWKGLHAELSNILEDSRIEREMIQLYPGTAHTLNEVARYMGNAGHYQHVTNELPAASIFTGYCLYWLQTELVGQEAVRPFLETATPAFEQAFPKGVVVRLSALLRKAAKLSSTAEAVALAEDIIKMLEEERDKEEQQGNAPESSPSSNQNTDPQQGQGDGQGDGGDNGTQDSQGDGQDQKMEPHGQSDATGQSQANGAQPGDPTQNQTTGSGGTNGSDVLQQVLSAGDDELLGDAHESLKQEMVNAAEKSGDNSVQTVVDSQESPCHRYLTNGLLDEVKSTTSKIRAQLFGLVQASQRSGFHTKRSGKHLDVARLHRVTTGDSRIFRRTTDRKQPNTAVHILVDMSGSMDSAVAGQKTAAEVAREAALSIGLALEAIHGVNPAITFFCGGQAKPVISIVKHGESVRGKALNFGVRADGGTPMAKAIWHAAFALSKCREERKMMVVITDGSPNNPASCPPIIKLCEDSSVDMVGIGVGTDSVKRYFSKSIVIEDCADLKSTLFALMEQSLTAA